MSNEERLDIMADNSGIMDVLKEGVTVAYYDLEFCNERTTHHNVPVAIGVSYRKGGREVGSLHTLIWCGNEYELWEEHLLRIGYEEKKLQRYGKPMEEVTGDLFAAHEKYSPRFYISLGRQDEELLKRFITRSLDEWDFYDAVRFLPGRLSLKYDISLERYAYICGIPFTHKFRPLDDARCLGEVFDRVINGSVIEVRRKEVEAEYDKKMFVSQYKNKRQAYEYLLGLESLTPGQREKMLGYEAYLKGKREKYLACGGD